ncbi:lysophospholipid acyltransferase family protein [Rosenbergiella epipactidis]|uniref:lysophospholipid acyltransferase family protein n=1 Tax=Rosenbergiella epipactidis TaxID=1544694 RepID=UPI001F4E4EA9|nr:lysophospholipid acyltransferase family protein [Rosenbergiella epipactidis]
MQYFNINRLWRLIMTAFCFALFGIGGLLLSLIWFPLLNIALRQRDKRRYIARRSISYCFKFFMNTMRRLGVLDYRIVGGDTLASDKKCLVVANHPSLIDYVMLASIMPDTDCIVKSELQRNIFVKGVIRAANYLINDQSSVLLPTCKKRFKNRETLIIFPEGTRTVYGHPLVLQRGAANIAVRCRVNIRLVHIQCDERMLDKQSSWYHIPARKPTFTITVGQLININDFIVDTASDEPSIIARQLNRYILEQLSHDGHLSQGHK